MADTTGCLVEDNIMYQSFSEIEINSGSIGNVFAYNFMKDGNFADSNHNSHNSYNLYEGNIIDNFESDGYYGSESEATLFRNYILGYVALKRFSRNFNI